MARQYVCTQINDLYNLLLIVIVDWSMEVVELCKKYCKDGVVAIDLAGDESLSCENTGHRRAFEVRTYAYFI